MKNWTRIYYQDGKVMAVLSIVELGDNRVNVAVVIRGDSRMEPGEWTVDEAKDVADKWTVERIGKQAIASRWDEAMVTP